MTPMHAQQVLIFKRSFFTVQKLINSQPIKRKGWRTKKRITSLDNAAESCVFTLGESKERSKRGKIRFRKRVLLGSFIKITVKLLLN